jgi:hypothetical protein
MDHPNEQQDKQMASQDSQHFLTEETLQDVHGGGWCCCGKRDKPSSEAYYTPDTHFSADLYIPGQRPSPNTYFATSRPTTLTPPSSPGAQTSQASTPSAGDAGELPRTFSWDRAIKARLTSVKTH